MQPPCGTGGCCYWSGSWLAPTTGGDTVKPFHEMTTEELLAVPPGAVATDLDAALCWAAELRDRMAEADGRAGAAVTVGATVRRGEGRSFVAAEMARRMGGRR